MLAWTLRPCTTQGEVVGLHRYFNLTKDEWFYNVIYICTLQILWLICKSNLVSRMLCCFSQMYTLQYCYSYTLCVHLCESYRSKKYQTYIPNRTNNLSMAKWKLIQFGANIYCVHCTRMWYCAVFNAVTVSEHNCNRSQNFILND